MAVNTRPISCVLPYGKFPNAWKDKNRNRNQWKWSSQEFQIILSFSSFSKRASKVINTWPVHTWWGSAALLLSCCSTYFSNSKIHFKSPIWTLIQEKGTCNVNKGIQICHLRCFFYFRQNSSHITQSPQCGKLARFSLFSLTDFLHGWRESSEQTYKTVRRIVLHVQCEPLHWWTWSLLRGASASSVTQTLWCLLVPGNSCTAVNRKADHSAQAEEESSFDRQRLDTYSSQTQKKALMTIVSGTQAKKRWHWSKNGWRLTERWPDRFLWCWSVLFWGGRTLT